MKTPLIMVVDDDQNFLEILSVSLLSAGLRVETLISNTDEEVVARAEALMPDLVVLDVYVAEEPRGFSFASALKRNEKTRAIKIVFWTSAQDATKDTALTAFLPEGMGGECFFEKDEDPHLLVEKIRSLI